MTNNPTIDGVSRGTIQRAIDVIQQVGYQDKFIDYDLTRNVQIELRALLDAPAVERQARESDTWSKDWKEHGFNYCVDTAIKALKYLANYERPSGGEQSYNAEHLIMTAQELELTRKELLAGARPEVAALQSTIAQLQARIAELESARGEPVAEVTCVISRKNKLFEIDILNNSTLKVGDKLFAAPPAPVAVVLPERADASTGSHDAQQGWNACLDATAALNGAKK